ncbi:hypothetical protein BUALT_Bualt14G0130500 [Buddleja alternifolia]|uniref:Agenet domain-containing protein n=1 Tax=Buddleja alternifolia TaxID=168488 RepID=A0AAV6WQM5_9LAMI|nr:hypothetical protein BUALT_Bualt14G0130500 [Buddleja alternifolia]
MSIQTFKKGDNVEIIKIKEINGNEPHNIHSFSYFSGNVLRSPRRGRHQVYVEYKTLKLETSKGLLKPMREYVEIVHLRPLPPQEGQENERGFELCENVDAFHDNVWRKGLVVGILRCSKYLVLFDGFEKEVEVDGNCLRVHREWSDGLWKPPFDHKVNLFV